jgi:NTE family protein
VVLARGELSQALRASMAVPTGLFAPAEIDSRLLVDGGVVANLPVDEARAMGTEIVIAFDLGRPMGERERPRSMAGILGRTVEFLTRLNVERALAGADIVIRPDVGEYGLLDFHASAELLERGEAAARTQEEALHRLAVDDAAWQRHVERQRRATPAIKVGMRVVDPGPGLALKAVERAVRTRPGRDLDPAVLRADLDRLWELGEYDTVGFDLRPAENGAYDLHITGHRKPWGPNYLRTGVGIHTDLEGATSFNVLGALTMTRLNRIGGELKTAVQIGELPFLSGELYQPLHSSRRPFVALGVQGSLVKVQVPVAEEIVQYRSFS